MARATGRPFLEVAEQPAVLVFYQYELEQERERIAGLRARHDRVGLAWLISAVHLRDGIPNILQRETRDVEQALDPPPSAAESLARARAAGLLPP